MSEDRLAGAVFADRGEAARAADELRRVGFEDEDIGFAMQQRTGMGRAEAKASRDVQGRRAADECNVARGSGTGAVLGGLLGEAAAGLAPGVGPIFAGGILSRLVSGTPTAAAGIASGLVEAGIPRDEAEWHERAIEQGRILLIVKAGARRDEATAMFERTGGSCFPTPASEREELPREDARD